jgi:dipeptidyl aminopeptidase/acylaminoacyl peptidase
MEFERYQETADRFKQNPQRNRRFLIADGSKAPIGRDRLTPRANPQSAVRNPPSLGMMPAMRRLLPILLALAGASALLAGGCGRDPEPPPPPPPLQPPKPIVVTRVLPAPLERIAFVREDGIWTVNADGGDLTRIVPPTCPRAAEPSWAPDRRWIAFTASLDPDLNLYPRNVFVARPDGTELRQVTPMPRATGPADDTPKGRVRGRAVLATQGFNRPVPGLTVTAYGLRKAEKTDSEGAFETYLPVGGGWVKIAGSAEGRPVLATRFAAPVEGRITDLKDIAVSPGEDDVPTAPAWSSDGKQLLYVLRHSLLEARAGTPRTTLRRINVDGTGDETVATFSMASILAGPVVRGSSAWCKMSEGGLVRIDLQTKKVADLRPAGISAPDALAVSPDGEIAATLTMDAAGARSIVLVRRDSTETFATFPAGEAAPHALDFSPDGRRLVLDRRGPDGKSSLWVLTLATKALAPLVDPGSSPVWHGR